MVAALRAMNSPLPSHLTSSQASSGCSEAAAMAQTQPLAPQTNVSLPSAVGNSQVATLLKMSSIGPAPSGPQSKVQHQVPQVVATNSPAGKASYLVATQGSGFRSGSTGRTSAFVMSS